MLHHAKASTRSSSWEGGHRRGRTPTGLPHAARDYLDYIEEYLGVPMVLVGVGPDAKQIVWTGAVAAAS